MPLPKELEGKSPEEIYLYLSSEHEKEINAERKALIDKLPKTEQQKTEPQKQTYVPPFIPPAQVTEAEPDYYTDPVGFAKREAQKAAQFEAQKQIASVLGNYAVTSQRPMNEAVFLQGLAPEDKEIYAKYKDEINANVDKLPPEGQADPRAFKLAFDISVGAHRKEIEAEKFDAQAEDLVKRTLKEKLGMDDETIANAFEKKEVPQRTSIFQPVTGINNPQPRHTGQNAVASKPSMKMDDVMKKIARGFGLSDEEYMKGYEEIDEGEFFNGR